MTETRRVYAILLIVTSAGDQPTLAARRFVREHVLYVAPAVSSADSKVIEIEMRILKEDELLLFS